jgi:hypothetical protein
MDLVTPTTSHQVVVDTDGRAVLVKIATTPQGATRLATEAATLVALGHPRTVEVTAHHDDGTTARLHLRWVGPHSLATIDALPPEAAAHVVAEVADVVADLHRHGLAHRRVTADHVLLDVHGRPVLTGLAEAVSIRRATPRDDVAALGTLLVDIMRPTGGDLVLPERRRARRGGDHLPATLLTLSDRARGHGASPPPSAEELAASLRSALGEDAASGRLRRRSGRRGRVPLAS